MVLPRNLGRKNKKGSQAHRRASHKNDEKGHSASPEEVRKSEQEVRKSEQHHVDKVMHRATNAEQKKADLQHETQTNHSASAQKEANRHMRNSQDKSRQVMFDRHR